MCACKISQKNSDHRSLKYYRVNYILDTHKHICIYAYELC